MMARGKWMFDRIWSWRTELALAIRITIAASAAYAIATALHLLLPLWAVLTSLIVTQMSVGRSLKATPESRKALGRCIVITNDTRHLGQQGKVRIEGWKEKNIESFLAGGGDGRCWRRRLRK